MELYIKERAKKMKVSLKDISEELGLSSYSSFMRTIGNGENLKLKQLQKISELLGCTIEELMIDPNKESANRVINCPYCGKVIKFSKEEEQ